MTEPRPRRPPPRRRRRRPLLPRVLVLLVAAVIFLVGLGLGEALHDGPRTGTQTLVRTLRPLSLTPAAATTVTVTVPGP